MSDHSDTHRKGNHPLFVHPPPVVDPHLENLAEHTHRSADRVDPAVGLTSQMMDCSIIQCPSTGLRCSQRRKTTGASRADYPMVGSSFLIGLEEIVTRDTRLCAHRSQSRTFDPRMIGIVNGVRVPSGLPRTTAMCSCSRTTRNPRSSSALMTFLLGASTGNLGIR